MENVHRRVEITFKLSREKRLSMSPKFTDSEAIGSHQCTGTQWHLWKFIAQPHTRLLLFNGKFRNNFLLPLF